MAVENCGHHHLDLRLACNGSIVSDLLPPAFLSGASPASEIFSFTPNTPCEPFQDLHKQLQEPKRRLDFRIAKTIVRLLIVGPLLTQHIYRGSSLRSRLAKLLPNVKDEPRPSLARLVQR